MIRRCRFTASREGDTGVEVVSAGVGGPLFNAGRLLEATVDTKTNRFWMATQAVPAGHPVGLDALPYSELDWHPLRNAGSFAFLPCPEGVPEAVWAWARSAIEWGEKPNVWTVGEEVDLVTCLAPRQTVKARLTTISPLGTTDRVFFARSLDGRTAYEGWVSTFHYQSHDEGAPLCAKEEAARSETIFYVMHTRVVL